MAGKSITSAIQKTIKELENTEEELRAKLLATTAKKNTLISFLKLDDPGERIIDILFNPKQTTLSYSGSSKQTVRVGTPAKTSLPKAAAHATEKPFADMTIGDAVCEIMTSEHNRKRHTAVDLADKIIAGGWRGRKGRATAKSVRPKISEVLNSGYGERSFKRVSRGVFTV